MSIFNQCKGVGVVRVNNCAAVTTASIIPAISVENFIEVPITGFTLDLGTNHQFLHTLDEFIYLYAFGDRIGELMLSGISFAGTCVTDTSGADISSSVSPTNVLSYYKENRVSREAGPEPVYITIGNAENVLLGFLTGMRFDVPNPETPVVQWALRYNVVMTKTNIPRASRRSAPAAAPAAPAGPPTVTPWRPPVGTPGNR